MLRCHEKFKTPWSLINHLLLCLETSKGDVNCQECQPSHAVKRLMSPVHLWRRLSGGRKRANGASLDWPLAKRGRVDELGSIGSVESLPMYEDMAKYIQNGAGQEAVRNLHELDASEADLAQFALMNSPESLFPETQDGHYAMTRHPLQQSWCERRHELAAGSIMASTRQHAIELDTPQSSLPGPSSFNAALRPATEHPWSAMSQDSTVWGTSPVDARLQKYSRGNLISPRSLMHPPHTNLGENPLQGLRYPEPVLRPVSGCSLAQLAEDTDPLEMEDGGDAQWCIGPDFTQPSMTGIAYQHESSNSSMKTRPVAHMTNPSCTPLKVVTQPTPVHAYGQGSGSWPLMKYQPITPASTTSGASATSSQSVRWPFTARSSSAHPSTETESLTKLPTPTSETSELSRRRVSSAGKSQQSVLMSPLTQGPVNSEDNISLNADSNRDDVCPHCEFRPRGTKNYQTHLKRHIKIHQTGNEIRCQVRGCGSTFAAGRKDNLQQHMNKVHNSLKLPATASNNLSIRNMPSTATSPSASFGYEDRHQENPVVQSGSGHLRANHLRRDSDILTGISSDRGTHMDSLQALGDFSPMEEGKDDLSKGGETRRPSNLGPTAWNPPAWI